MRIRSCHRGLHANEGPNITQFVNNYAMSMDVTININPPQRCHHLVALSLVELNPSWFFCRVVQDVRFSVPLCLAWFSSPIAYCFYWRSAGHVPILADSTWAGH